MDDAAMQAMPGMGGRLPPSLARSCVSCRPLRMPSWQNRARGIVVITGCGLDENEI